jgi:hypothetical protein
MFGHKFSAAPCEGGPVLDGYQGLKPITESLRPFGTNLGVRLTNIVDNSTGPSSKLVCFSLSSKHWEVQQGSITESKSLD